MKYSATIVMLPRLLDKDQTLDYVCGQTMLDRLGVEPLEKRKGLTVYDRLELDRAIDRMRNQEAADALAEKK